MDSFFRVHNYGEVASTNDIVKQMAKAGEAEGFVAVAERQRAGRGRMGRGFFSPEGGLYISALLRPAIAPEKVTRITTMAAVAVCEAIEDYCGKKAGIKWVNDVIVDGRKVCGILTEAAASGEGTVDYAVVGIGVNVAAPKDGFPSDISNKAGALYEGECPNGAKEEISRLILDRLGYYYKRIESGDHAGEYARRSILIGCTVDIITPSKQPVRARVLGVDTDCALVVEYENGEKGKLSSGEVSVRYEYE